MRFSTIIGLALATASAWPRASVAQGLDERTPPPSLSVVGHGKVAAVPDVADINIGVVTHGPTAKDALRSNSEAMEGLQNVLKERGIAAKDIETKQIQVNPVYSHPDPRGPRAGEEYVPKVVGYRVTNSVEVTVREIAKLGEMLDAVVVAGANQVTGIAFRVDKPEQLLDQARKLAMADAKRKAELLAGEAGIVLGPARHIIEAGGMPPRPTMLGGGAPQMMMARSAAPVAAGEQELSVSVQVSYSIMPPKS
ncbi:MAG TPA: SIMPL domain-containing protein [Isosphaeraceae bacterium]|jgi:hypothetical protein